ncbi:beta-ketoacyl-ACP synthase III [Streptomyces coacervatus]|uniref:Beta-ketoacyl-ACP synthase III n=1 Tax=Streptomyces coacervatus TaxID=647381 RepID=A0ABP7I6H5_9ACTN|nr:ketoacyl-ACP synthase III [Streptomyces coacervatus]MDF2266345.1 ketoacyl-ACP synthase III [Streptomyces coacervatus]
MTNTPYQPNIGPTADAVVVADRKPEPVSVGIRSLGAYVPGGVVTNQMVADWASADPEWVAVATGITERRIAAVSESTSAMCEPAAREALQGAAGPIDALILATSTPDQVTPPTATALQARLGLDGDGMAFDLNAACGGFVYGLAVARGLISTLPTVQNILLVGADQYSKYVNRSHRATVALFGDGAGAVTVGPVPDGYGIQSMSLAAYSEFHDEVGIFAGGTREPLTPEVLEAHRDKIHMNGKVVRRVFVEKVTALTRQAAGEAGWRLADIDRFVFHQGNPVMLQEVADVLGIDADRVGVTGNLYGNTGCGSMPLTLHHMNHVAPLRRGEKVLFAGAGGGITVGAVALTWW